MEVALFADLGENSRVYEGRSGGGGLGGLGASGRELQGYGKRPPPRKAPRVSKAQHLILHLETWSVPRLTTQRK